MRKPQSISKIDFGSLSRCSAAIDFSVKLADRLVSPKIRSVWEMRADQVTEILLRHEYDELDKADDNRMIFEKRRIYNIQTLDEIDQPNRLARMRNEVKKAMEKEQKEHSHRCSITVMMGIHWLKKEYFQMAALLKKHAKIYFSYDSDEDLVERIQEMQTLKSPRLRANQLTGLNDIIACMKNELKNRWFQFEPKNSDTKNAVEKPKPNMDSSSRNPRKPEMLEESVQSACQSASVSQSEC